MTKIQINDTIREMTSEEEDAPIQAGKEAEQREADALAAFEARKEPLRRLGLTEDEINTVLGI